MSAAALTIPEADADRIHRLPETAEECDRAVVELLRHLSRLTGAMGSWISVNRDSELVPVAHDEPLPVVNALSEKPERRDGGDRRGGPADRALQALAPVRMEAGDVRSTEWAEAFDESQCGAILALPCIIGADRRAIVCTALPPGTSTDPNALAAFGADAAAVGDAYRRLEAQRARLRLEQAWSQASLGCFLTDRDGRIEWINDACLAMSGHRGANAIGSTPRMFQSGKQSRDYYRQLWETIRQGQFWSREIVERRRDGDEYLVRQTASPLRTDGKVSHFLATHEDVTDAGTLEQRIERSLDREPITGLLTRAGLFAACRLRRRQGDGSRLGFVGVYGLREFASLLGPDRVADALRQIGEQLRECFPLALAMAYLGDGNFALLLDAKPERVRQLSCASALSRALREPVTGVSDGLRVRLRFGLVDDDPSESAERLLLLADDAAVELG